VLDYKMQFEVLESEPPGRRGAYKTEAIRHLFIMLILRAQRA
jgi:hypothetical protein